MYDTCRAAYKGLEEFLVSDVDDNMKAASLHFLRAESILDRKALDRISLEYHLPENDIKNQLFKAGLMSNHRFLYMWIMLLGSSQYARLF